MAIEDEDTSDLIFRHQSLLEKYVPLAAHLNEELDKFGKYRKELQVITVELNTRGVSPEDPERLRTIVEQALKGKNAKTDTA